MRYADGDPNKARTANAGFACRVDTSNGIWGFCPETVIAATDCGLAAACVDSDICADVCGLNDGVNLTTVTCTKKTEFCSTALLTAGPDQTWSYVACGPRATTDHLLVSTTESSSSQTPPAAASTLAKPLIITPTSTSNLASSISASSISASTSSSPSNKPPSTSLSSTNSTAAIVGGTIGGLAFLCFVAFAVYVVRRLKSLRSPNAAAARPFVRRSGSNKEQGEWSDEPNKTNAPAELSTEARPFKMPSGRQYETAELSNEPATATSH